MPLDDQLEAINRARATAERKHGVTMSLTIDYPRHLDPEPFEEVVRWAADNQSRGITAVGLGGPEAGYPPERFRKAFQLARDLELPAVPHAGETAGAESIRGALDALGAVRIGHGVRCLEDPDLVAELRDRQVPLEVCPTSNVRLQVCPTLEEHPFPRLLDEGLYVTLNSDDPPMFGTTLTDEYLRVAAAFNLDSDGVRGLVIKAGSATLLPPTKRAHLLDRLKRGFGELSRNGTTS
jgi:adenosine deaminase